MKNKLLVNYSSVSNFMFWFIQDRALRKNAELDFQNLIFKTNLYKGKIKKINKYVIFFLRYFFPLLLVWYFIVPISNIFLFISVFTMGSLLGSLYYISFLKKRFQMILVALNVIAFLITYLFFKDMKFLISLYFNIFNYALVFILLIKIIVDFNKMKNMYFGFISEHRLFIYFDKSKGEDLWINKK